MKWQVDGEGMKIGSELALCLPKWIAGINQIVTRLS